TRERFKLIVLDPPPFARGRTALAAALRGYKEINLRALRLLVPGGRLATFSCSHYVDPTTFEATCREAAADAGVRLRVLDTLPQGMATNRRPRTSSKICSDSSGVVWLKRMMVAGV